MNFGRMMLGWQRSSTCLAMCALWVWPDGEAVLIEWTES